MIANNKIAYDATLAQPKSISLAFAGWKSIPLEPGVPFAPFAGLTPEEVADAFNEELLSTQTPNQRP